MRSLLKYIFLTAALASTAFAASHEGRGLLLISIDGLDPDYVARADEFGLRIPNLRRLARDGVQAAGVRGVLPTVTYPTHTTMLTGVLPAANGIHFNTTFDPQRKNLGGWYWYNEDVRSRTLWEAAADAGYVVGSVAWPVSVGARGVRYLIPEYWRAMKADDDLKLLRALSSPALLSELERSHGKYIIDLDNAIPGDWMRTRYAESILREKGAPVLTLHLAALDHIEHETGPASKAGFAALEEIDRMVAVLEQAIRSKAPNAAVCIVSDHGMARVDRELNLKVAFIEAGLMTVAKVPDALGRPAISAWKAQPWPAGGSAAILLTEPGGEATLAAVRQLLDKLAADPANGIAAILDREAIRRMGGSPDAAFWVDLKPGFAVGSAFAGPIVRTVPVRGTHGYAPTHPEMRASFIIAGPEIRKGEKLGDIAVEAIAPTLAEVLQVKLPGAAARPLPVLNRR